VEVAVDPHSITRRHRESPPNVFDIEPRAPLGALAGSHVLLGAHKRRVDYLRMRVIVVGGSRTSMTRLT
jgi:hypothetical protein